ncbi:hypothetical protein DB346_07630 [Verrucomicrobia bacterium LW23]|nr:hypothetical protein DB346_07630 [Verrucomicrobia bacterium LW23]
MYLLVVAAVVLATSAACAADFFTIREVRRHTSQPRDGAYAVKETIVKTRDGRSEKEYPFIPCIEAKLEVKEATRANTLYAKAYFYDATETLLATAEKPCLSDRGSKGGKVSIPPLLEKGKTEQVFFAIPEALKGKDWRVLVVFGDKQGGTARLFPSGSVPATLQYPEKEYVNNLMGQAVTRKPAMDPVVELVVKTGNEKAPQLTLFLRPPVGMTDASKAKGVMALCLLANNTAELKRRLQGLDSQPEMDGLLKFAQQNDLLILAWGARRGLWDPSKNWDEQSREITREMDESFDDVANAWARGMEQLSAKYGFPNRNMLLWGVSGSAQFAARLALRKPEYFLAVNVHIPSSFDKPTPEGARVLWCLTTGERESGYERSKKFFMQCKEMGYPIIYKAIIGLGHQGHPKSSALGFAFFKYALTQLPQRQAFDAKLSDPYARLGPAPGTAPATTTAAPRPDMPGVPAQQLQLQPWLPAFVTPLFVGDIVNQEMFPFKDVGMVPGGFRVMLPTKELADIWKEKGY